jgi:predicted DNA-binding WGR domain protein
MKEKTFSFGIKLKFQDKSLFDTIYMECVNHLHDKYYYLCIRENIGDLDYPYKVICHFGRNGTGGTVKVSKFKTIELARSFFKTKVKQKSKEYTIVTKPTTSPISSFLYKRKN